MGGDASQPVTAAEPRGPNGSGPSAVTREVRERVHEMAPALAPVAPPLVQPAARLIPPPAPPPKVVAVEAEDEEREPEAEAHESDGQRVGAGAAAPPPPGSLGPRVQRTSLPEMFLMMTQRETPEGGLLADDDVQTLTSGQMRKRDFLRELRAEVTSTADTELRRFGRTAADCPFIPQMLDRYERRTASEVERSVRRYAPSTRTARDAHQYISAVAQRVPESVRRFAETGQVPEDLPDEEMQSLRTARGWVGAIASMAGLQPPERPTGNDGAPSSGSSGGSGGGTSAPQRKAIGPSPGRVDGGAIVSQLGPGRPLDGTTRTRMEAGFGHSFATVRIHADDTAASLNRDLSARAFTIGPHVAYGAGAPQPGTIEGDALLAHELAHVVQQGTAAPRGEVPIGDAGDEHEHDADQAAAAVVANLHAPSRMKQPVKPRRSRAGLSLQRCGPSFTRRTQAELERVLPMVTTINRTFGVPVTEEDANWTAQEVDALNQALGTLNAAELREIAGVSFVRVASTNHTVGASSCGGGRSATAITDTGAGRVNGTPTRTKRVRVSNDIASADAAGMRILLVHELGHVIEHNRENNARLEVQRSADRIDPAFRDVRTTNPLYEDALQNALNEVSTATYQPAQRAASAAFVNAMMDVHRANRAMFTLANERDISIVVRDQANLDAALGTALAGRDRELAALRTADSTNPAINRFADAMAKMDRACAALRTYVLARADNERAAITHRATQGRRGGAEVTARLAAFGALVDANNIGPLVWRGGPQEPSQTYTGIVLATEGHERFVEEMFAEAFAMWRIERASLRSQAPSLVQFFDNNGHLQ